MKAKFRGTQPAQIKEDGIRYLAKIHELISSTESPVYNEHNYTVGLHLNLLIFFDLVLQAEGDAREVF